MTHHGTTTNSGTGNRTDSGHGSLEALDGRSTLRFERHLRHPIDLVWQAVSEPEHLAAWFPTTIDGERRAGAPLRFRFTDGEPYDPFDGEMLTFEPPHRMAFRWGTDEIRLELTETGDGTLLVLLDLLELHGRAAGDAAGWHVCLDALTLHLDGRTDRSVLRHGWVEVQPHYVTEFGPEAATIGPPQDPPSGDHPAAG